MIESMQGPGERQDTNMQRVACHYCFRAGTIPWGLNGGSPPPTNQLPPAEDWLAGALQALTQGLEAPKKFLPPR